MTIAFRFSGGRRSLSSDRALLWPLSSGRAQVLTEPAPPYRSAGRYASYRCDRKRPARLVLISTRSYACYSGPAPLGASDVVTDGCAQYWQPWRANVPPSVRRGARLALFLAAFRLARIALASRRARAAQTAERAASAARGSRQGQRGWRGPRGYGSEDALKVDRFRLH